jgi:uncharacterized membrane protein YdbT with pleckstrin-like domain
MGISPKLLSPGERVVVSTRTHWKVLILPVLALIVVCAVAGFLIAVLPSGSSHDVLLIIVLVVAAALVIWFSVRPFLNWLTATYTVTDRRLITRWGIFVRRGRDTSLQRINNVEFEKGVIDRILGCGTLIVSDASEEGGSKLNDVPHVEQVQLQIHNLLFGAGAQPDDDRPSSRGTSTA